MKRFFIMLLIASLIFIAGVAVGRFVIPRKVVIITVDIKDMVEVIERYNAAKHELERIEQWNEKAIIEPESEPEKED